MPEVLIRRVTEDGAEPVDTVLDDAALTQFVMNHESFVQLRAESVGRRREITNLKKQLAAKDAAVDDEEEEEAPPKKKDVPAPIDPDKLVELAAQRVLAQVQQQTQRQSEVAALVKQFRLPEDVSDLLAGATDPKAMAARLSKLTAQTGELDPQKKDNDPNVIMAGVMKRLKLGPDEGTDKEE